MTKRLKCYYLLLIRHYKLSLLNQFLAGFSIMAVWGKKFFSFFFLFFYFSAPLKCHWPIRASSLKSHSPAGRIHSPLATGRVLMKRLGGLPATCLQVCLAAFQRKKKSFIHELSAHSHCQFFCCQCRRFLLKMIFSSLLHIVEL